MLTFILIIENASRISGNDNNNKSIGLHVYDAELSSINVFLYLGMTLLIGNFELMKAYKKKKKRKSMCTVQSVLKVNAFIQYRNINVGENAINGVNMMAFY